eukprot:gene1836-16326_t
MAQNATKGPGDEESPEGESPEEEKPDEEPEENGDAEDGNEKEDKPDAKPDEKPIEKPDDKKEEKDKEKDEDKDKEKDEDKDKNEESPDDFGDKGLKAHNMYRKIHKTPEMKLNEKMSKEAEEYAKKLAEEKKFRHSDSEDGENLAMGCSSGGRVKVKTALSNAVTISTDEKLGNVNSAFAEGAGAKDGEQEGKGGAAEGGNDAGGSNNSTSEGEKSEKKPDDVGVGAEGNQGSDDIGIQAGGDESKNSTGGAAGAGKDSAGDAAGDGNGDKGAGAGEGGDDKGGEGAGNAGGDEEGNKEGDKEKGSEDGKANEEQESDKGTSEYSKQGADAHNILRKIHKTPDVKSNDKMAEEAEAYAKELAATFKFEHSKSKDGENLAMSCSSKKGNELSAADATKMWYVDFVCGSKSGNGKKISLGNKLLKGIRNFKTGYPQLKYGGKKTEKGVKSGGKGKSFSFVTTEESKNDKSFEKGSRNSGTGKFNKEPSTKKFADDSGKDAGGSGGGSFAENGLKAHNMFRKIHGAPEMKLDEKMSKEAEDYAKKLADMGTLQHADTDYGENLAMKCSSQKGEEMTAEEATKNWYEDSGFDLELDSKGGDGGDKKGQKGAASNGQKGKGFDEGAGDDSGKGDDSGAGGDSGKGGDSSGGNGSPGSFSERGLKAHNMFRKIHGAPEMKLDEKMSKEAEEYAKKLADMGTLQHANTDYGENLAMKCSSQKGDEMTAEEATKNWYETLALIRTNSASFTYLGQCKTFGEEIRFEVEIENQLHKYMFALKLTQDEELKKLTRSCAMKREIFAALANPIDKLCHVVPTLLQLDICLRYSEAEQNCLNSGEGGDKDGGNGGDNPDGGQGGDDQGENGDGQNGADSGKDDGGKDDGGKDDGGKDKGNSDGGGEGGGSFADRGLKAHNMFRKIHGAPEMKLDEKMSKEAEEYAKKLADMGTLQHANTDYGENLAMKCSSQKEDEMTAEEATKNW